jgi:hypothetical protein
MIVLYSIVLFVLVVARFLVGRRARALERKYSSVSAVATNLAHEPVYRPGNSNRHDALTAAKRQYELALLAHSRDRLEARHYRWQNAADKLSGAVSRLRRWKGRKLPYTFGVVDVSVALALIDHLGFRDYVSVDRIVQTVTALLSQ